jgi:hypothetical protein
MANRTRTASNDNLVGNARNIIGANGQDRIVGHELGNELTDVRLDSLSGNQRDDTRDGGADSFVTLATLNNVINASLSGLLVLHGSIP